MFFRIALVLLTLSAFFLPQKTTFASIGNPTVLITGSNRGIGLEFVKQYASMGWRVIATTRKPIDALSLKAWARLFPNILIEQLDVTNSAELAILASKYKGQPIDVLINNAGVSGDFYGAGQRFGSLDYESVDVIMNVNAVGPLRVTEAFYENVKNGQQKKVVAITALLGVHSFGYGGFSGAYWYKLSKAAMNAGLFNLSRDVIKDGVIIAMLTPGEVAVEKVVDPGPNFISPEVSIKGMIEVINHLTLEDSGAIIRYNGKRYDF
jgi:NAD(P)-dependent dehydrogenase (short-subunit alcohol dehydrogenase family)